MLQERVAEDSVVRDSSGKLGLQGCIGIRVAILKKLVAYMAAGLIGDTPCTLSLRPCLEGIEGFPCFAITHPQRHPMHLSISIHTLRKKKTRALKKEDCADR
jgi:hypothetical protein